MYPYVLSYFLKNIVSYIPFHQEALRFKKSFCSLGRVLRATTIEANHSFWL
jgi:hypothetical protein